MSLNISLNLSPLRLLTDSERRHLAMRYPDRNFKYVTMGEYKYVNTRKMQTITIPIRW